MSVPDDKEKIEETFRDLAARGLLEEHQTETGDPVYKIPWDLDLCL